MWKLEPRSRALRLSGSSVITRGALSVHCRQPRRRRWQAQEAAPPTLERKGGTDERGYLSLLWWGVVRAVFTIDGRSGNHHHRCLHGELGVHYRRPGRRRWQVQGEDPPTVERKGGGEERGSSHVFGEDWRARRSLLTAAAAAFASAGGGGNVFVPKKGDGRRR